MPYTKAPRFTYATAFEDKDEGTGAYVEIGDDGFAGVLEADAAISLRDDLLALYPLEVK